MGEPAIPSAVYEIETYTICRRIVQATVDDAMMPLPIRLHSVLRDLEDWSNDSAIELRNFIFRLAHQIDRMRPVVEAATKMYPRYQPRDPGKTVRIEDVHDRMYELMSALDLMRGDV